MKIYGHRYMETQMDAVIHMDQNNKGHTGTDANEDSNTHGKRNV
jgi:hypothetical protein